MYPRHCRWAAVVAAEGPAINRAPTVTITTTATALRIPYPRRPPHHRPFTIHNPPTPNYGLPIRRPPLLIRLVPSSSASIRAAIQPAQPMREPWKRKGKYQIELHSHYVLPMGQPIVSFVYYSSKKQNWKSAKSLNFPRVSPMIREFVQSVDDREWTQQLFSLLQSQSYNQCEVDVFELMCKVLDQNLFSQVDWARNTVFFKDLKVNRIYNYPHFFVFCAIVKFNYK